MLYSSLHSKLGIADAGFTEASQSKPLRQGIYYCLQALEQGSVEKNSKLLSASATASTISYTSLNSSAWEALHGQAPTLAILACEATDLTSGVRYFQVGLILMSVIHHC